MPTIHPLAGQPAPDSVLVDIDALRRDYYAREPDVTDATQRVTFGTSGHRGSSLRGTFSEAHILAITQAICTYRLTQDVTGPLYVGKDTHALSQQAFESVLEVLAGNGVHALIDLGDAVWAHPLTTLRIPVWILRHLHEEDGHGPASRRALAAGLDPWTDRCDLGTLTALVPAAERISCLHRAESWRRLQADVPVTRVDEPFLRSVPEWLVDAAAPDPYASAVAR